MQNRSRLRDMENKLAFPKGEREGGRQIRGMGLTAPKLCI